MTILTEGLHAGEFLVSEANAPGWLSRESVIVASGANLGAGTVLGRIVASAAATRYTGTAGGGVITMDPSTPLLAGVQEGRYTAVCIEPGANVGQFEVFDPQGVALGLHTVAGAAFASQIKFTIADATDFVAGDMFEIFVSAGVIAATTDTDGNANTGNGTLTLYQTMEGAQNGVYTLTGKTEASNAGTFSVVAPNGDVLPDLTVATRYATGGLDLLVADGSNDWDIGDRILVTVNRGKVKAWDPSNTDGSGGEAFGILYGPALAASADVKGVAICRNAEVNKGELAWDADVTAGQKASALASLAKRGVIAR